MTRICIAAASLGLQLNASLTRPVASATKPSNKKPQSAVTSPAASSSPSAAAAAAASLSSAISVSLSSASPQFAEWMDGAEVSAFVIANVNAFGTSFVHRSVAALVFKAFVVSFYPVFAFQSTNF